MFGGYDNIKMVKEANLLVTFDPTHQQSVLKEIAALMKEAKEKFSLIKADEGVAELMVQDSKKTVKQLMGMAKKNVDKFGHTFHWIPIEKWVKNNVADIKKVLKEYEKGIKENEKWKMDLKVRKVKTKPDEVKLIMTLTEDINRPKVDLENPDKIIKVEIVGNKAGLALLGKDELLNTSKFKK